MNNFGISKYEKPRIIGARAEQLAKGAKPLVDIGNLTDPVKIAMKEFSEGVIPISINRNLPNKQIMMVDIKAKIKPEEPSDKIREILNRINNQETDDGQVQYFMKTVNSIVKSQKDNDKKISRINFFATLKK
jgi:DNA-directed RNA polymerase subunit K